MTRPTENHYREAAQRELWRGRRARGDYDRERVGSGQLPYDVDMYREGSGADVGTIAGVPVRYWDGQYWVKLGGHRYRITESASGFRVWPDETWHPGATHLPGDHDTLEDAVEAAKQHYATLTLGRTQ